jgi:hypothetical protein
VVECTGLEIRQSRKRFVGSNPTPSANTIPPRTVSVRSQYASGEGRLFGRPLSAHDRRFVAAGLEAGNCLYSQAISWLPAATIGWSAAIKLQTLISAVGLTWWWHDVDAQNARLGRS